MCVPSLRCPPRWFLEEFLCVVSVLSWRRARRLVLGVVSRPIWGLGSCGVCEPSSSRGWPALPRSGVLCNWWCAGNCGTEFRGGDGAQWKWEGLAPLTIGGRKGAEGDSVGCGSCFRATAPPHPLPTRRPLPTLCLVARVCARTCDVSPTSPLRPQLLTWGQQEVVGAPW